MPTEPKKPLIVISYAHEDEPETPAEGEVKWLSFVTGYLRPAMKHGAVDLWLDRLISGGADWEREIEQKLRACDIFILLVSRHSLSSDYVVDKEIALIGERQGKGEEVHFYPLVLTPTPKLALDLVRDKNLRPHDGKPLSDYSINERYRHMSNAADEIAELASKIAARKSGTAAQSPAPSPTALSPMMVEDQRQPEFWINDHKSLEVWLSGQSREVAIAIAARSALRAIPLAVCAAPKRGSKKKIHELAELTGKAFHATAVARVVAKYPARADDLRDAALRAAITAARAGTWAYNNADGPYGAAFAAACTACYRALYAAALATEAWDKVRADIAIEEKVRRGGGGRGRTPAYGAAFDVNNAAKLAQAAYATADVAADAAAWEEVRADIALGECALVDAPLWSSGAPQWAKNGWAKLRSALPSGRDWDVWTDWYEERLHGGSRGEDYELVFAGVPKDIVPEAVNPWIKAHLPKTVDASRPTELPTPLRGLDAPFAYGWSASQRVTGIAGAQNLPFYPHFSSEEDHRRALEAARVGGERLLKALRAGRYNARREYGEALEYYLDDLPKTAGAGNILLANNQARILHDMFLADVDMLPAGFASSLKNVIGNQLALNAFYDLVQRHNEAVGNGNWSRPFPLDATRGFFGAVEDNTPRWFERDVEQGLRQVEYAEPPPAVTPESASTSAIEPPPLPPGTPDAQNSWRRQMATAANALWETFLQGQNMPVAQDDWRKTADELGAHVRPIIDFLRAQEKPKD
jgi:hypothetical protein